LDESEELVLSGRTLLLLLTLFRFQGEINVVSLLLREVVDGVLGVDPPSC
jgi:hypothetical protein